MRLYLSSFRLGDRPDALLGLLRGGGRRAAVIAAAVDHESAPDRAQALAGEMDRLRGLGLDPFEVDLRHHFDRPDHDLRRALTDTDVVWVRGGNTWVLRRALRHSGADAVVRDLLARDAVVYAGYSAGPAVLGPTLDGIDLVDDPHVVPPGYPAGPPVVDGLGVLPYVVVPHYRSDHPESDDIEHLVTHLVDHHVPFVALRDGQALVLDGTTSAVVG